MQLLDTNKAMQERYTPCLSSRDIVLPRRLMVVLESGLVRKDGCVFLASLLAQCRSVSRHDFPDMTGYECFVNKVHLDNLACSQLVRIGVTFLHRVSNLLRTSDIHSPVIGIVSADDASVTARFHLLRAQEAWLSDDLNGYTEECIAVFEL